MDGQNRMDAAAALSEVCDEIKNCKQAIAVLTGKKKCDEPCLIVGESGADDGICVTVSRFHAMVIVAQVLENLDAKYSSLSEKLKNFS